MLGFMKPYLRTPAGRLGRAAFCIIAVGAATGFGFLIDPWLPVANISVAYLTAVMLVAMKAGRRAAILASGLSFLAFNFFFTEPRFTLVIADTHNVLTVVFFLVAAVVVSNMAERLRSQMAATETARGDAERERLRSALLSSLSHDLRTPLVSIMGAAPSLVADEAALDSLARRELAQTIQEEAERLNRFVQNLLDMTRLGAGALRPRLDWADLGDIVGSALQRVARLGRSHVLAADLAPDLPLVKVDTVLLEQALFNLLDNACKYSPSGSAVTVTAERAGEEILLTVLDQGPGIPPADRERVFDMFTRTAQADLQVAGTGLGLAIARGIVEAHGGRIAAEAGPAGAGTAMRIRLPMPPHPRVEVEP
jgi:K+-sensing histidine kinase KdpD